MGRTANPPTSPGKEIVQGLVDGHFRGWLQDHHPLISAVPRQAEDSPENRSIRTGWLAHLADPTDRLHPVAPKTPRNRDVVAVPRALIASLRVPIMANFMAKRPGRCSAEDGGKYPAVRLSRGCPRGRSQRNQPDSGQRGRVAAQFMLGSRRGPSIRSLAMSRRRHGLRRRALLRRRHRCRVVRCSMTRR